MSTPLGLMRRFSCRLATYVALGRARAQSRRRAMELGWERILVVCYGNIYRSPLAAAYLARVLPANMGCEIRSAGFHSRAGRESREEFVLDVREKTGVDLTDHRSSVISAQDLRWAQMIIVMDRHNWHAVAMRSTSNENLSRVIWLGALRATGTVEISDPYGQSHDTVAGIIEAVMESVDSLARIFLERARHASNESRTLP